MLDIKFIRENAELVKEAIRKKRLTLDLDQLLNLDIERLKLLTQVEQLRAQQNEASTKISQTADQAGKQSLIREMSEVKREREIKESNLKEVMLTWKRLMLLVPNIPDMSVPEGDTDADNQLLRQWGTPPQFNFTPKNQIELLTEKGLADFERGTKVAGFRGYLLRGAAVKLSMALWQLALDLASQDNFTPLLTPSLLKTTPFLGTGYLPAGAEDLYKTQDGDYFSGTAEVPLMGMWEDELMEPANLPLKLIGLSPCFRREAGSHGKDTKGLLRVHEFYKVEQVIICQASHEESVQWHENLLTRAEQLMQVLKLPYRVVTNCSGDLGLGQVKKYDIEVWLPSEQTYRETHSISYFHDFQTRRLNLRYKDAAGKIRFAHSLNGTLAATPRLLVALLENHQQADGSIILPESLHPYGVTKI